VAALAAPAPREIAEINAANVSAVSFVKLDMSFPVEKVAGFALHGGLSVAERNKFTPTGSGSSHDVYRVYRVDRVQPLRCATNAIARMNG
jgi:hypothetical protein